MKNKMIYAMMMLGVVVGMSLAALTAHAAITANPVEGRLRTVYSDFITVAVPPEMYRSNDSNQADIGEMKVNIDASTHYANFNQLGELKEGDQVRVEFRLPKDNKDPDKRIASIITKVDSAVTTDTYVTVPETTTTVTTTTTTTP